MFHLLFDPLGAIAIAKKKSLKNTILTLLLGSVVMAVASLLMLRNYSGEGFLTALLMIILFFVATLFMAFLLKISFKILTGKKDFIAALTALTYGYFFGAFGFLIASILWLIPSIGSILGGIVLTVALIISHGMVLKLGMILYKEDLLMVIVALCITYMALFVAAYFSISQFIIEHFDKIATF